MAKELFDLTDRVALITGSSRGIGRAIAERMAEHGARVVVSSRKQESCDQVAAGIVAAGGKAIALTAHVAHKDQLQALVDGTLAQWGAIDILVCNAAINPYYGPSIDCPDDAFDRVMGTNVRSNFWLCNMVLPQMASHGGGAVIVISSIAGLRGTASLGAYGISKAADMALVRNIAVEWGPKNVRANCLAPGVIKTDFARALWEDPVTLSNRLRESPLARIGEPDEVAGAAIFLAGPAGRFTTGQTIVIDGGVTVSGTAVD